jgi:hypothetical protein
MRKHVLPLIAISLALFAVITNPGMQSLAQNAACYMVQGGASWTAGSGCTFQILSGGTFTAQAGATVTLDQIHLDTGTKTATASSGAATLNTMAGVVTSESLSTAAGATYTLTLTNSDIAAADQVLASVQLGSATTGMPAIATAAPGAGSVVIKVQNIHASAALNGTIKIAFAVLKN